MMREHYGLPMISLNEFISNVTTTPIEFYHSKGLTDTGDQIYELYKRCFEKVLAQGIRPFVYNDVQKLCENLTSRAHPMAVVSSHPTNFLEAEINDYKLRSYFKHVFGEARDKVAAITKIYQTLDIAPEHTIYIGDTVQDIPQAQRVY